MKKVCIYLYSGTGMTKYVVANLKAEFEKQQITADVFNIEDIFSIEDTPVQSISCAEYDGVGIAYPVHSFNAPEIVIKFARSLPKAEHTNTFIISTAGGDSSLNFAASDLLIKTLRKKGFNVFYNRQFIMPSNFIVKDNETKVKENIEKVIIEAPKAAREIINHVSHSLQRNFITKIVAFLGRAEWYAAKNIKFFYADENCIRCDICAENCPNRNIALDENRAFFKRQCGLCMRCLYICPQKAVKTRRLWKFLGFESWYEHDELSVRKGFL